MTRKQLSGLFLSTLVTWSIGNGMFPLLPVYASRLGADPALVGYYLSLCYIALTLGTLAAGWLSDKLQRRKRLLILAGALIMPALWLMGRAGSVGQLIIMTAMYEFLLGLALTLPGILAGLFTAEAARGRIFGMLAVTDILGGLVGSLAAGFIAERWGYAVLFSVLAIAAGLMPLLAVLLPDKVVPRPAESSSGAGRASLGAAFYLLLLANFIISVAVFTGLLSISLAMNARGFLPAAIASTAAVGALVVLPSPPLIGWLSDRSGRKPLLVLSYLATAAGLWLLAASSLLWHFWAASALLAIILYPGYSVGSAFATDLVPPQAIGRGLSAFSAAWWAGGIGGFALSGTAIQLLGLNTTLAAGAVAVLIALGLLLAVRRPLARAPVVAAEAL